MKHTNRTSTKQIQKTELLRIQEELAITQPGTPEYQQLLAALDSLESARTKHKSFVGQLIAAGIPLIGTVLVLQYENLHNLGSKAINLLPKYQNPRF